MSNNIKDLIKVVLTEEDSWLQTDEIHDQLTEIVEISERRVNQVVREMYEDGELDRNSVNNGTRGRPAYEYTAQESENATGDISVRSVRVRGDIEMEGERSLPEGVYWDIVDEQASSSQIIKEIKEVAPKIADEDPVELFVEMCRWTVEQLQAYGEEIVHSTQDGRPKVVRALRSEYNDLAEWADGYFHQFLRLPDREDPRPEAVHIPDADEYIESQKDSNEIPSATIDEEAVREHLSQRIYGDKLIQVVEIDENIGDAVGTDASISTVSLPSQSRLAPETTFDLLVGAAGLDHDDRQYNDYDFNPRNIREFRHREAFQRGFLLSADALPLRESEVKKARAAAMDLRQYRQCHRVINDEADWEPYGNFDRELDAYTGPDVMFVDGRLTPLVHQQSEFVKTSLYGQLVRREIREFAKLADYADAEDWKTSTVFAGVVKRPGISWFSPLVFWYLETQCREGVEVNPCNVYRPPISDVVLPHLLFVGLSEQNGAPNQNEVYTTARILRRFSDNSIPKYDLPPEDEDGNPIDLNDRKEWMEYFKEVRERREDRGREIIDLDTFERFGFAELCANVGTLMCYAGPSNLYRGEVPEAVRLPRMEVLVNPPEDAPEQLSEAISLYAKKNVEDEEHLAEDFSDINDLPVVVPSVITLSDEMAKAASDRMKEEVSDNIQQLVATLDD